MHKLQLRLVAKDLFVDKDRVMASCGPRPKKPNVLLIRVDSRESILVQVYLVLHELVHALFFFLGIPDAFDDRFDFLSEKLPI